MTTTSMLVLAALTRRRLAAILDRLPIGGRRGRPSSCSRSRRVLITCAALRTNLTIRELAATYQLSKSATHRILSAITSQLAAIVDHHSHDR